MTEILKDAATVRPWIVQDRPGEILRIVRRDKGTLVCSFAGYDQDEANAALICEAVNEHDSLKEKCERYEEALKKIAAYGGDVPGDDNLTLWQILALNPQAAVEIAAKALATPIGRDGGKA